MMIGFVSLEIYKSFYLEVEMNLINHRYRVIEVLRTDAFGEVLVVEINGKNTLIPFRKEFIKEVNIEKKKIDIIMWEGLL